MLSSRKLGENQGIPPMEESAGSHNAIQRPAANPFANTPDDATPNSIPARRNPFLIKPESPVQVAAIESAEIKGKSRINPFIATKEENSAVSAQPKTAAQPKLQRTVNFSSSSTVSPFSSGAFNEQSSSSGHFGVGGEDFDEEDERNLGAPTIAAIAKARSLAKKIQGSLGTFANGFQGGISLAGYHGTFAQGFEDAEQYGAAEEAADGMDSYENGYEEEHYEENGQGEEGQEDQYFDASEATEEFVGAPLGYGQIDSMYNAWGLPIAPVLPTFYDDVDEVEEVTVSTSDDEDMDDSFTFANSSGEFPTEVMGFDYSGNGPTTSAGSKRAFEESTNIRKRNKKSKKNKSRANKRARISMENSSNPSSGRCPDEISSRPGMKKYWYNRYELFSKYDEGIKLDLESWFSVTPEKIAEEISNKFSAACPVGGIIIDAFCGCGGNSIQFAKSGRKVISIDIDPVKIENAKHNARIYGVEENITFIVGDFMALAPALKADAVFLSPPWGGPEYTDCATFDLETMIPINGFTVFELAQTISPNIGYFVPRHVDTDQLMLLAGPGNSVEIQKNYYLGRVKAITAYYGNLVDPSISESN